MKQWFQKDAWLLFAGFIMGFALGVITFIILNLDWTP